MTNDSGESGFDGVVGRPAQRALEAAGYTRLEDLTHVSEKHLLALHGFGPKGVRMLNAELVKRGLAIGSALEPDST